MTRPLVPDNVLLCSELVLKSISRNENVISNSVQFSCDVKFPKVKFIENLLNGEKSMSKVASAVNRCKKNNFSFYTIKNASFVETI